MKNWNSCSIKNISIKQKYYIYILLLMWTDNRDTEKNYKMLHTSHSESIIFSNIERERIICLFGS